MEPVHTYYPERDPLLQAGLELSVPTSTSNTLASRKPFRFQRQYHDDESGLRDNRYRYDDPEMG